MMLYPIQYIRVLSKKITSSVFSLHAEYSSAAAAVVDLILIIFSRGNEPGCPCESSLPATKSQSSDYTDNYSLYMIPITATGRMGFP
jgi:hypothetical protein